MRPFIRSGPSAIRIGDTWYVYFDMYRKHRYGVVISKDLENWEDITDKLNMPKGAEHGSIFRAPKSVVEKLLKLRTLISILDISSVRQYDRHSSN